MRIVCPSCGQPVPGVDIDLATRAAVCRPCGELIPLPLDEPSADPKSSLSDRIASAAIDRPPLSVAEHVDRDSARFVVDVRLRIFGAVVLSFAGACVSMACALAWQVSWVLALLTLLPGLAVAYFGLIALTQRMSIVLDRTRLTWRVRPFTLTRTHTHATADIDRFVAGGMGLQWWLRVVMRDGRVLRPMSAFKDAQHAAYLANRLNEELRRLKEIDGYRGLVGGEERMRVAPVEAPAAVVGGSEVESEPETAIVSRTRMDG